MESRIFNISSNKLSTTTIFIIETCKLIECVICGEYTHKISALWNAKWKKGIQPKLIIN